MLNIAAFTGRLTHDPELRTTKAGTPVATFRIAVARDFVKEGDIDVDFFDIVAWRSTAEFICKYFNKGKMINVKGRLKNRKWKDKEGNERVTTELQVESAYFGESRPSREKQSGGNIDPFDEGYGEQEPPGANNAGPWDDEPPVQSGGAQPVADDAPPELDDDDVPPWAK